MKKLFLFCIALGISLSLHSQTGLICTTPVELASSDTTITSDTLVGSEKWYRFLASSKLQTVTLNNISSSSHVHKTELYSGSCTSLNLIASATVDSTNDSVLIIAFSNLKIGSYYYIKVKADETSCTKCGSSPAIYSFSLLSGSAGGFHSLFLCANGNVLSTGRNTWGQLGNATFTSISTPAIVPGVSNVIAVSAGADHSLALLSTGTIMAWGNNGGGQLGNGSTTISNIPVPVSVLTNVIAISAGNTFSLALKGDGTVWAWGYNVYGQLGNGTTITSTIPIQVLGGLSNVRAISAGESHSLALKNDGTVWGWGENSFGELGNNTLINQTLPVQEWNGFTDIIKITAGTEFSIILNSSGIVYGTGWNSNHQLGNGTLVSMQTFGPSVNVPVGMTDIDAGGYHSLAIRNDGTVWGWGANNDGELGNGTTAFSLLATQVVGSISFVSTISAGWFFSIMTTAGGLGYGFGDNTFGQLGDATTTDRHVPTPVILSCPVAVPPLVITGINSVCFGAGTNLTVTTGVGPYSWAGPGLSSGSGTTVTATPTTTTTYTVTDAYMNTGTYTVTVISCGPICTYGTELTGSSTSTIATSPLANAAYSINNISTTISGAINFTNSSIQIGTGVTIFVPSGSVLTINHCHLFACADMWNGIIVQPGGKLIIAGAGSLIEDAITAIYIKATTFTAPANYALNISGGVTFNKNYVGIKIDNYIQPAPVYPFIIKNTVFTNRTLPYSLTPPFTSATAWTLPANLKILQSPGTLNEHYINSAFAPTLATLTKAPYIGQKPHTGILLDNVGVTNFGPVFYEIFLGKGTISTDMNLYDNLLHGIHATNSNFATINSAYQYMRPQGASTVAGIAIHGINTSSNISPRARIIPQTPIPAGTLPPNPTTTPYTNKFYDNTRSVDLTNYYETYINGADVRSTQTVTPPSVVNNAAAGSFGFYLRTNRYNKIEINSNVLTNIREGIIFTAEAIGAPPSQAQFVGPVNIDYNYVQAHYPGNTVTTQYVRNAIAASNVITSGGSITGATSSLISTEYNKIYDAYRGIYAANWQKQFARTDYNFIRMNQEPPFSVFPLIPTTQYGISHVNNSTNTIIDNNIQGTTTTKDTWKGIYSSSCGKEVVSCNLVALLGRGIEFENPHFGVKLLDNKFFLNARGLMLNNNGVIGAQTGTTGNPASDNQWLLPFAWVGPGNRHTYTNLTAALLSPLNVQTGATYTPFNNDAFPIGNRYLLPTSLITVTPGTARTCDPIPTALVGVDESAKIMMADAVQNFINYLVWVPETDAISRHRAFRLLKAEPALLTGDIVLQNYYTAEIGGSKDILASAEDDLKMSDFTNAQIKINSVSAADNIEENYKTFYNLFIKHQTDTITNMDSLALATLAYGCPSTDGVVVYQARALYNSVFNTYIAFEDNCPEGRMALTQETVKEEILSNYLVYPNPAKDELFISVNDKEMKSTFGEITDVTGKVVYSSEILIENLVGKLNLNLENGVYLINIIDKNAKTQTVKKIVISK